MADFIRQKRINEQILIKVRTRYKIQLYQILRHPSTTVHADVQFKYKAVCAHTQIYFGPGPEFGTRNSVLLEDHTHFNNDRNFTKNP